MMFVPGDLETPSRQRNPPFRTQIDFIPSLTQPAPHPLGLATSHVQHPAVHGSAAGREPHSRGEAHQLATPQLSAPIPRSAACTVGAIGPPASEGPSHLERLSGWPGTG
jgi:hypothetical protein